MKRCRTYFTLLLALALAVSVLPLPALAAEPAAQEGGPEGDAPYSQSRALVLFEEDADGEALAQAVAALPGVELVYTYGKLFAGAAVEAGDEALAAIRSGPGPRPPSATP